MFIFRGGGTLWRKAAILATSTTHGRRFSSFLLVDNIVVVLPRHNSIRNGTYHNNNTRRNAITTTKSGQSRGDSKKLPPVMSKKEHRIHIVGAGAVGLFLACKLRLGFPSFPLHIIRRSHPLDNNDTNVLRDLYVSFQHADPATGKQRMQTIHFLSETPQYASTTKIRNLIVTTKAFSAVQAIASLQHRFLLNNSSSNSNSNNNNDDEKTNILLFCNGALAIRDELLNNKNNNLAVTRANIYIGYTTHGIIRLASNIQEDDCDNEHIIHTGIGHVQLPVNWGSVTTTTNTSSSSLDSHIDWMALWNRAQLSCRPSVSDSEMEHLLWLKLAANCVINPMTAIYQCTNGALPTAVPEFETRKQTILQEVSLVAQAAAAAATTTFVENHPQKGAGYHDTEEDRQKNRDRLSVSAMSKFCNQVMADTQNNKSSMLQDVLANRQPEIDYLTGYVVRKGRQLGIPTPENERLLEQLHHLTTYNNTWQRCC